MSFLWYGNPSKNVWLLSGCDMFLNECLWPFKNIFCIPLSGPFDYLVCVYKSLLKRVLRHRIYMWQFSSFKYANVFEEILIFTENRWHKICDVRGFLGKREKYELTDFCAWHFIDCFSSFPYPRDCHQNIGCSSENWQYPMFEQNI